MKKFIYFLILIFTFNSAEAQRIKYEDIIEIIKQKDYPKAYILLFEYQKSNPDFANTYFQLGNICYELAFSSNPLKDSSQTLYYIQNSELFYGLAINKLSSQNNDAKKYADFYKTVNELAGIQKIENVNVVNFMNQRINKVKELRLELKAASLFFTNFVHYYNLAIEDFIFIINKYSSLNEIYIQPKDTIVNLTKKLIIHYDSAFYFYNRYNITKIRTDFYGSKQIIEIKPINIYRLEGIARTNLLADTLFIWDYKKWAQDIQYKISTDINHFRQTISKTNEELVAKENEIVSLSIHSNNIKPFYLEQKVIFEIEKYDYNSLISALFKYRNSKIDFLVYSGRVFNDTANNSLSFENRAKEYFILYNKKLKTDTLLLQFVSKIDSTNYLKHQMFLHTYYSGLQGIKTYSAKQKDDFANYYYNINQNTKYFLLRDVFSTFSNPMILKNTSDTIPLYIRKTNPKDVYSNGFYTNWISTNNADKYQTGFYKSQTGTSAYVSKISSGNIVWTKTNKISSKIYETGTIIDAYSSGCWVIVRSAENISFTNTIQNYDSEGVLLSKNQLNLNSFPRYLDFDEINNYAIIAFQGQEINYFDETKDSLTLVKYDTKTNKNIWQKNIKIEGNLINILKIDTTIHLIFNYQKLIFDNKVFQKNQFSIIGIVMDLNGNYLSNYELNSDDFLYGIYANKINNHILSIIAIPQKTDIFKTNLKSIPGLKIFYYDLDTKTFSQQSE